MPLFEFECESCGFRFEELVSRKDENVEVACTKCGKTAKRRVSRFASVVSGGSPTESVDMTIGREADRRWQMHNDRQSQRRKDRSLQDVAQPRAGDGKYMPVMALGKKEEKAKRTEYVGALQEHRRKRKAKGIPQFSGPGEF